MKTTLKTLATLIVLAAPTAYSAGLANSRPVMFHQVPDQAAMATSVGSIPPEQSINLLIALPLRNRESLTKFISQLSDPASTNYHHYLSPDEFTGRFGPTVEDYESLVSFARSNHLEVTATHPNRTILNVRASASKIQETMRVSLGVFQHPHEARTFFAASERPSLNLDTPVLSVRGLDNFSLPRPLSYTCPFPPGTNIVAGGSGPGGTFRGTDFRAVYAPGVTLTGAGQKVGLLELDGYFNSDITAYHKLVGAPLVPLKNVFVNDYDGTAGANNLEVALDIEMVMAMAPNLEQILVYEAGADSTTAFDDILNRIATDNLAKQISSSWVPSPYGGAVYDPVAEQIYQQFAAQGQSFFQASGDQGAFSDLNQLMTYQYTDSPYVTLVGGTTLSTLGSPVTWDSERVWNWLADKRGTAASGGGISLLYSIPDWQKPFCMCANGASTTMRNVPDVAMVADNIFVIADKGTPYLVGGTSAAAPLWAGFTALVNQQSTGAGLGTVGFLNPALYNLANGPNYANVFHDITFGNNTNKIQTNAYYASVNYDLCTGLGTPTGVNLINALAPPPAGHIMMGNVILQGESFQPTNGVVDPGETVTVSVGLTLVGQTNFNNVVATLIPGGGVASPGPAQSYGAMGAGHPNVVTRSFRFTSFGTCGNVVTATLQLQDGGLSIGSVSFELTLGNFVPRVALNQSFDTNNIGSLPSGWTSTSSGDERVLPWSATAVTSASSPMSVVAHELPFAGESVLNSPVFPVKSASAQLSFANRYALANGWHGGVLEVKIGNASFTDILQAGGAFVTNGYNSTLIPGTDNPLAGRSAWTGISSNFVTTVVNLPSAAAGQNVQLRWRCGDSAQYVVSGWYLDNIKVVDGGEYTCDSSPAMANLVIPKVKGGDFTFIFQTSSNRNYTVYSKSTTGGNWSPFMTVRGDGTPVTITNKPSAGHQLFRVSSP